MDSKDNKTHAHKHHGENGKKEGGCCGPSCCSTKKTSEQPDASAKGKK
jgi:hypothetical protein